MNPRTLETDVFHKLFSIGFDHTHHTGRRASCGLGAGRRPERSDISRAIRLSSDVQWMLTAVALALPW